MSAKASYISKKFNAEVRLEIMKSLKMENGKQIWFPQEFKVTILTRLNPTSDVTETFKKV